MKTEAQRIAIAEAHGWKRTGRYWLPPSADAALLPRDDNGLPKLGLEFMHEAEEVLTNDQRAVYAQLVDASFNSEAKDSYGWSRAYWFIHATAAQRAEAFLRAIGKWQSTPPPDQPAK